MKKAVFLDRDGTINVEKNYLYQIKDFEFLPGVLEGLRKFKEAGYLLIIATNQSGIARGYYSEEQYYELETWMLEQMRRAGVQVDAVYHCPHLPDAQIGRYRQECECRKPKLGMFKEAIKEYDIDVTASIAIGDRMRDLVLCENGVTQGYLVYGKSTSEETTSNNVHCVNGGIKEVAEIVLKDM